MLMVFAGLTYYGFDVVRVHSLQEVIAFKQFSEAVLEGNRRAGFKMVTDPKKGLGMFKIRKQRMKAFRGKTRYSYYSIRSITRSADGKIANLNVDQITHLDPPGMDTFFGTEKIVNRQVVTMVMTKSSWKIQSYQDNYYRPGMKAKKKRK